MQQFTVPQFIDVEDKIIGPVTTRQFLILLADFLISALFYKIFDFALFLTTAIIGLIIAGTLSFLKVNGRPFHFFILNFIQTLRRPGLRVWNNQYDKVLEPKSKLEEGKEAADKTLVGDPLLPYKHKNEQKSRLGELSLIVDTKGRYRGD